MSEKTGPDPAKRTFPMPVQGHALPNDQWQHVVSRAEQIRAESDESETK